MSADLKYELGLDTGPFQAAGDRASIEAEKIAAKIEHKFSAREIGHVLAAALGINIEEIAKKAARLWIGVSEEEEKLLEKNADLSEQAANAVIKLGRSRLSDELKYQAALQDRDQLQERIENRIVRTTKDQIEQNKDKIALAEKEAEVQERLAKIYEKTYEEQAKLRAWVDAIKKKDQEDAIAELAAAQASDKEYFDHRKSLEQKLHDLKFEALSPDEQRLQLEKEIAELQASGLKVDSKSTEGMEIQVKILEKQKQLRGMIKHDVIETAQVDESNIKAWTGFMVSVKSSGRGDKDLSDRELARKAGTLKADIARREQAQREATGDVYGGNYDGLLEQDRYALSQLGREQALRSDVRRTAATMGEQRAFNQFSGLTEQRFAEILRSASDSQEIVYELKKLNNTIRNTGVVTVPLGGRG